MSDHDLAEIDAAGSPAVVQALVDNHRQFLSFLEARVGSRATAQDILQEAFARGLDRLDTVRSDESAVAWFYRVLRNAVIDHYRRAAVANRSLQSFAIELQRHVEPDVELREAICGCVVELKNALKPEYAQALELVELQGLPVKEFAERVGISTNNAGVRVFRAREALRKQVARSCGTCAEHGCLDCTCQG